MNAPVRIIFALLVWTSARSGPRTWRYWWAAWRLLARLAAGTDVRTVVHGRRVLVPVGYPYQVWSRRHPNYNAPLVEVAREAAAVLGRPLRVVDVGAAVGDTALLLLANLPQGAISDLVCVEPDDTFARLAETNLAAEPSARVCRTLLGDGSGRAGSLVRIHPGTASAQGTDQVAAQPLDDAVPAPVDVLKIDVDGMDGVVLAGAARHLRQDRPIVVFEWHPALYEATGNDWHQPFAVLRDAGYRELAWFDKTGEPAGIGSTDDTGDVARRAHTCLVDRRHEDWHYDVVALPPSAAYGRSAASVAALRRSAGRSRY